MPTEIIKSLSLLLALGILVAGIGCRSEQLTVEQVVEGALEAQESLNSYHFEMTIYRDPDATGEEMFVQRAFQYVTEVSEILRDKFSL